MHRALYRKWRPATFDDVVGQESIVTALKNQLLHDKIGHAYLFTGTRGTGKTTCAKIFAKAVNCETPVNGEPCGKCAVCTGIDSGSVMDVVEIDAASNNGVDNIRDLRDETAYTPGVGKYKVYIIDEVHMLSMQAFNALLKIMEEPPSHVIFILATTEIHKVPATILSRCQRYDFVRIAPEAIAKRLLYIAGQEQIVLSDEAAGLIARLADGALRDALSILDTCAGLTNEVNEETVRRMAGVTDKSYLFDLTAAISAENVPEALGLIARLRERSIDMKRLCDELILHYRNLLIAGLPDGSSLLSGISRAEEVRYCEAARAMPQSVSLRAVRVFCEALDKMGKGSDARIELELAVFKLCTPEAAPAPVARQAAASGAQDAPAHVPFAAATAPAYPAAPNAFAPGVVSGEAYTFTGANASAQTNASAPANDFVAAGAFSVSGTSGGSPVSAQTSAQAAPVGQNSVPASAAAPLSEEETPPFDLVPPEPPFEPSEATSRLEAPAALPAVSQSANEAPAAASAAPVANRAVSVAANVPRRFEQTSATLSAGKPELFARWPEVVTGMAERDKLLYANLKHSKAYYDGKRVLIDGGELFLEYMRKSKDSSALIKQAIADITGVQYPIGPYSGPKVQTQAVPSAEEALEQLALQGVPIIYEDEQNKESAKK